MNVDIPVDKAGRLVLPKEIRRQLHLKAGDILEAEMGVNEVRLRPRHTAFAGISRQNGRVIWDAPGGAATVEEIEDALQRGRVERDVRASAF